MNFQNFRVNANTWGPRYYVGSVHNNIDLAQYLGSKNLKNGKFVQFGVIHYSGPFNKGMDILHERIDLCAAPKCHSTWRPLK